MTAKYLTPYAVRNKDEFSIIFEGRGSFWFSSFSCNVFMQKEAQGKGLLGIWFYLNSIN